jgi:hypothetical protein
MGIYPDCFASAVLFWDDGTGASPYDGRRRVNPVSEVTGDG